MAEHEMRGGVYAIRNLVTQKKYIGSAVCIAKRISQHVRTLRASTHRNVKLQRAWDKYGAAAFEFVVLAIVEEPTALIQHEQAWINFLDSVADGYNIAATAGSLLGFRHTTETRQRMSEARKGRETSLDHRAHLSRANRGKKMSAVSRQKMRDAKLGKARGPLSQEHKARISAANSGRRFSFQHRAALSRAASARRQDGQ